MVTTHKRIKAPQWYKDFIGKFPLKIHQVRYTTKPVEKPQLCVYAYEDDIHQPSFEVHCLKRQVISFTTISLIDSLIYLYRPFY
jgi:hypothetical protein